MAHLPRLPAAPFPAPLQPFALFVGLRYTRAKRRNHFISFISLASMLGIALGIAALVTVMSVMNGFEREVRARILGVAAQIDARIETRIGAVVASVLGDQRAPVAAAPPDPVP